MPTDTSEITSKRDIVIYKTAKHNPTGHSLITVNTDHPMYDPLMYVLMFPFGDKGYKCGSYTSEHNRNKKCTMLNYYQYRLMPHSSETLNTIHRMGRLFQHYIVDIYSKIEGDQLSYIR